MHLFKYLSDLVSLLAARNFLKLSAFRYHYVVMYHLSCMTCPRLYMRWSSHSVFLSQTEINICIKLKQDTVLALAYSLNVTVTAANTTGPHQPDPHPHSSTCSS